MKILLLGPVGCGKGTQAGLISAKYGIAHISTGEMFRNNIAEGTELGKQAKAYIDAGDLVPEEITINMVKERLKEKDCEDGFILDGFPRNLAQAKALDNMTTLDKVIMIHLPEEEIIKRLSSRRMCRSCNQPTSTDWMVGGVCEKCGGEVYIRDDDKPEVIKNRLVKQAVSPELIEFYKNKDLLVKVDSTDDKYHTFESVDTILQGI